jgi:D-glycero-D-manno-heptose 1,7-bisphosphate phosphatase
MERAIFLDRDGVLINDPGNLYRKLDVKLLPGVESLVKLQDKGYLLLIISNQSVVARGTITENEMWDIDRLVRDLLKGKGVEITASYYCPHHPDFTGECDCRKPKPGLFLSAIKEFDVDPSRSVAIGDKFSDLEAGRLAGIEFGILLKRNGEVWHATEDELAGAQYKADNLIGAVGIILEENGRNK